MNPPSGTGDPPGDGTSRQAHGEDPYVQSGCVPEGGAVERAGLSGRPPWHSACKESIHTSTPGIVTALAIPARLSLSPYAIALRLGALSMAVLGVVLF